MVCGAAIQALLSPRNRAQRVVVVIVGIYSPLQYRFVAAVL